MYVLQLYRMVNVYTNQINYGIRYNIVHINTFNNVKTSTGASVPCSPHMWVTLCCSVCPGVRITWLGAWGIITWIPVLILLWGNTLLLVGTPGDNATACDGTDFYTTQLSLVEVGRSSGFDDFQMRCSRRLGKSMHTNCISNDKWIIVAPVLFN